MLHNRNVERIKNKNKNKGIQKQNKTFHHNKKIYFRVEQKTKTKCKI